MYSVPAGLLLDFGNVITISLFEQHRQTEELLGLPRGSLTWLGPIDPSTDPLWRAMQHDEITEREYWARRAQEIGRLAGDDQDWDMLGFLTRIRNTDPNAAVRPEARRAIRAARAAGIKVGVLSNELELFYGKAFLHRFDVLKDIDCIVDATHTRILKPSPQAYALGAETMGLPAERILFVDDQFRNIAGAHQFGMQTQFFDLRDPGGSYRAVLARLGLNTVVPYGSRTLIQR